MAHFTLDIEPRWGTDIRACAKDAIRLANRLDLCARFNFNGVLCFAYPGDNPLDLVNAYHDTQGKPTMPATDLRIVTSRAGSEPPEQKPPNP